MRRIIIVRDGRQYEVEKDSFIHVSFTRYDDPDKCEDLDRNPVVGVGIYPCASLSELKSGLDIGGALAALKNGKKVRRAGWHAKDKYLWFKPPVAIKAEWCKDESLKRIAEGNGGQIDGLGVICMYLTEDGKPLILTGWHPTPCDFLAEDWEIME